MLQSEFTTRTKVHVSAEEYAHIEAVYMASDVDKDEFCRLWVLMNKERVARSKEEAKQQAAEQSRRESLWRIVERYDGADWETCCKRADDVLTDKQKQLVQSAGIELSELHIEPFFGHEVRDYKQLGTVIYELKKYLKAA